MKTQRIIKLLIIGHKEWCIKFITKFNNPSLYHLEIINDFNIALKRLQHNSYDILLLEEDYFKYESIRLCQLSYAMSRPSIILCNSIFKYFMYKFWKTYSIWTNKYPTAKKLIHIKLTTSLNLISYFKKLLPQHDMIRQISNQIRSNSL